MIAIFFKCGTFSENYYNFLLTLFNGPRFQKYLVLATLGMDVASNLFFFTILRNILQEQLKNISQQLKDILQEQLKICDKKQLLTYYLRIRLLLYSRFEWTIITHQLLPKKQKGKLQISIIIDDTPIYVLLISFENKKQKNEL
jgi:hypothetical protein